MKIFVFAALTSVLSVSTAQARPVDLEDLTRRWDAVEKVDNSQNLMSMDFVQFDTLDTDLFQLMERSYLEPLHAKKLSKLDFKKVKVGSRDVILDALFPKGVQPLFCSAFPEPKLKGAKAYTPEEQAQKYEKQKANNCRAKVKEILGGILYSNPEIIFGEFRYEDQSAHVIFYLESSVFQNNYLRYEFHLSQG